MRLTYLRIQNFRACKDITLEIGGMHALVGANNAGKSSMLRALDFLFNPSTKSLNEESFWNKDNSLEIRVEATGLYRRRLPGGVLSARRNTAL